eukprot:Skav217894  [mRNA]  locus=scaffold67:401119:401535:+ [translate_table: standard]
MEVGLRRSERLRQTAPESKRRKSGQTKEKSLTERLTLLELDFEKELPQKDDSEESQKPRRPSLRRGKARPRRFTFKELEMELASEAEPNFFSCEVGPSMWPKRLRCHCLKWARYKCPRCSGPFCSLECQKAHSEVLCR